MTATLFTMAFADTRLPLHGKRGDGLHAIIDSELATPDVLAASWTISSHGYPIGSVAGEKCYLHKLIACRAELPKPNFNGRIVVDHKNGNKLDNRACNLRWVTCAVNSHRAHVVNAVSGFKGVVPHCKYDRWIAQIKFNFKTIYISSHGTPEEAARAYDAKARELFGDFALTNEDLALYAKSRGICPCCAQALPDQEAVR